MTSTAVALPTDAKQLAAVPVPAPSASEVRPKGATRVRTFTSPGVLTDEPFGALVDARPRSRMQDLGGVARHGCAPRPRHP
ncbi:hypothetical protein OK074_5619 [Actinobacteria bacterium OK074]|nr:hypothetical protein OK074_5619 [Actinobacteria bacterium OK074]